MEIVAPSVISACILPDPLETCKAVIIESLEEILMFWMKNLHCYTEI